MDRRAQSRLWIHCQARSTSASSSWGWPWLSITRSAAASRSSRLAWRAIGGGGQGLHEAGVLLVEPPVPHQALHRDVGVQVHHDGAAHVLPAGLDEQRHVQDHHSVGRLELVQAPLDLLVHPGVHDRAQVSQGGLVGEDQLGDGRAVELTVGTDDPGPEPLHHLGEHDGAGLLQVPNDGVGVDDCSALGREARRHRRLARSDPARQPDQPHEPGP